MIAIEELAIPARLDDEGGADFARAIELGNALELINYGTADLSYEPSEELPLYQDPFLPRRLLVARLAEEIVGRAVYETQVGEGADTAWITVEVLPEFAGGGIGRSLANEVEALALADGKAKALCYCAIRDAPGPRLSPPTGFGSIPAGARSSRFLLARGYSLEQLQRVSLLRLPLADLHHRLAEATAASGPDYAVRRWHGPTPARWLDDQALLNTRMSTDAPTAGLEEPENIWSAERVAATDELGAMSPRRALTAAVEHLPSGRVVGFTRLSVPPEPDRSVAQEDTLVLREHRGHKLGMLLKLANIAHLEELAPGHPSISTFNAEENRHMLAVNEAVGFEPIAYEGAWRKNLTAP
jgi:GNAT superfamily N-acetyltransferase